MRRIFSRCCPRAASDHVAAAPPSTVMNSRRFNANIELPSFEREPAAGDSKQPAAAPRPSEPGWVGLLIPGLLDPLPCGFGCRSRRRRRVGVFKLVWRKRYDQPLLLSSDKVRKNVSLNARDQRLVGLVDGIGTETGDKSRHDSFVFLRCALIYALGSKFGNVGPRDELREMAIRVEYEDALGVGPPAITLGTVWFHVECGDECPGSHNLLFEGFLLADSIPRQQCESQRCECRKTENVTPIHCKPPW